LIRANKILQEEFEAENTKLKEVFAAKELAFKNERELLIKAITEDIGIKKSKQDKGEDTKFMKKELEDYKKRYKETIKESSVLRNKVIELTGQNEKLSKNAVTLNKKVDDLATKLKKSDVNKSTTNLTSLNEQRLNKKKRMIAKQIDTSSSTLGKSIDNNVKRLSQPKLQIPEEIKFESEESSTARAQSRGPTSLKATTAKLVMCRPIASTSFYTNLEDPTDSSNKKAIINTTRCKTPLEIQQNTPFKRDHSNTLMTPSKFPMIIKETGRWQCVYTEELHDHSISSLVSIENYLISSSNVIKLWDIEKKITLAKMSVTNSKLLYALEGYKLLIAASEQSGLVSLYSLPSLEVVHSIDTGLDSVKAVYSNGNYICLSGAGDSGSLQIWDINAMSKLHSNESNNDIGAIFYKDNVLYYGGQNCCVNRFRTDILVILHVNNIEKY